MELGQPLTAIIGLIAALFVAILGAIVASGSMHGGHGICEGCDRLIELGRTWCDDCIEAAQ